MLEVTDPRSDDPFAPHASRLSLGDLVESFVGTPYAETTAALRAIHALVPDEVMRARIGRELDERRHPMPDWLTDLDRTQVEPEVWFLTHVLGDGDDYLIGVTLPSGHGLSALVYVDHNLGTVVKDAFVVGELLEDLALKVGQDHRRPGPDADPHRPRDRPCRGRGCHRAWCPDVPAADVGQLADVPTAGGVDAAPAPVRGDRAGAP